MKTLRFGCVYGAPPIFNSGLEEIGYVDLSEIQMSDQLRDDIAVWDQNYQTPFSNYYPPDSGLENDRDRSSHNLRGKELAARFQEKLKDVAFVEFIPIKPNSR